MADHHNHGDRLIDDDWSDFDDTANRSIDANLMKFDSSDDDSRDVDEKLSLPSCLRASFSDDHRPALSPAQQAVPILPNGNDVCFKAWTHPATQKWRLVIKAFSDNRNDYPVCDSSICNKILQELAQDNITRFLVCRNADGKPCNIKEGQWFLATDWEIIERTKERFKENRKNRSQTKVRQKELIDVTGECSTESTTSSPASNQPAQIISFVAYFRETLTELYQFCGSLENEVRSDPSGSALNNLDDIKSKLDLLQDFVSKQIENQQAAICLSPINTSTICNGTSKPCTSHSSNASNLSDSKPFGRGTKRASAKTATSTSVAAKTSSGVSSKRAEKNFASTVGPCRNTDSEDEVVKGAKFPRLFRKSNNVDVSADSSRNEVPQRQPVLRLLKRDNTLRKPTTATGSSRKESQRQPVLRLLIRDNTVQMSTTAVHSMETLPPQFLQANPSWMIRFKQLQLGKPSCPQAPGNLFHAG